MNIFKNQQQFYFRKPQILLDYALLEAYLALLVLLVSSEPRNITL